MSRQTRRRPHPFVEAVAIDNAWKPDGGPTVHVVLVEPEIPQNTGTIVRLCAATGCPLHLIEPLGFDIDDRTLRRAGLDYWDYLELTIHTSPEAFLEWLGLRKPWVVTRQGAVRYDMPPYADDDVIIFGSETQGLPAAWIQQWEERSVYIPILGPVRNLSLIHISEPTRPY